MSKALWMKRCCIGTLVVPVLLWLPGAAIAQNYDDPGLGDKPVVRHPQDYKPLGIRAGAFMLHPGVHLATEWNDNVFFTEFDKQSDTVFHIRPYLTMQSNWTKHSFNVRLAADFAKYNDFSFRDYEDYFLTVNGQIDVKNRSFFTYQADYFMLHEGLNTRDSEQGIEPTQYTLAGAGLGYDHSFNRLSVAVDYTFRQMDFDDVLGFDGVVIDNQDRDRDRQTASLRMGYQFQTEKQAFFTATANKIRYDLESDRNDFNRDSDGYTLDGGLAFTVTGVITGNVFVRYMDQQYDDPALPDISGWGGGAGIQWHPSTLTSVAFSVTSGVVETTNRYSSGYLRTLYSVRVDHELLRNLQISGHVGYANNNYELTDDAPVNARETDKIWRAGVGMSWFINRSLFFNASYDYQTLNSNVPGDDYDVNRVWLILGLER
jgi:hypothetical protein